MAIITISRGSFGLGQAVAEKTAAFLEYPCLGREMLREVADRLGLSRELLDKKIEKAPNFWQRLTGERKLYITAVQAVLSEHAAAGNLVYHGYAGHLLLKGLPTLLRVRVIAPMEKRIPLAMEQEHLDRHSAEVHIRQVDENRARWTQFIYDVNWQDPSIYDVILNLDVLSLDGASEAIVAMVRRPEFALDDQARKEIADFALASQVKLALARSHACRALELEVRADGDRVVVGGVVPTPPMMLDANYYYEEDLRAAVLSVKGVRTLSLELTARPPAIVE